MVPDSRANQEPGTAGPDEAPDVLSDWPSPQESGADSPRLLPCAPVPLLSGQEGETKTRGKGELFRRNEEHQLQGWAGFALEKGTLIGGE